MVTSGYTKNARDSRRTLWWGAKTHQTWSPTDKHLCDHILLSIPIGERDAASVARTVPIRTPPLPCGNPSPTAKQNTKQLGVATELEVGFTWDSVRCSYERPSEPASTALSALYSRKAPPFPTCGRAPPKNAPAARPTQENS